MTAAKPRQRRLSAIERELRQIREALPQILELKALTAQQAATIGRLIGENDRFRDCIKRQAARYQDLRDKVHGWRERLDGVPTFAPDGVLFSTAFEVTREIDAFLREPRPGVS